MTKEEIIRLRLNNKEPQDIAVEVFKRLENIEAAIIEITKWIENTERNKTNARNKMERI